MPAHPSGEIIYSVLVVTCNHEHQLKDLYRSLEGQSFPSKHFEVIVVDDGSTDATLRTASSWQKETSLNVRVIGQGPLGLAVARNVGVEAASGNWLLFMDANSFLHPEYLTNVEAFRSQPSQTGLAMMCTRPLVYSDDGGGIVDIDPFGWKFRHGDRVVALNVEPHILQPKIYSTAVLRDIVTENNIQFLSGCSRLTMDMDFIGRYLVQSEEALVGLVAAARSYYHLMTAEPLQNDISVIDAECSIRYDRNVPLALLRYVIGQLGFVPVWIQNIVLYDTSRYLFADRSWNNPLANLPKDQLDKYWRNLTKQLTHIDVKTIQNFMLVNLGWNLTEGLLRHFKNEAWIESNKYVVYRRNADKSKRSQFIYSYVGETPTESCFVNGQRVEPYYAKSIRHDLFGNLLMYERILALPDQEEVTIFLNGNRAEICQQPKPNRLPTIENTLPNYTRSERDTGSQLFGQGFRSVSRRGSQTLAKVCNLIAEIRSQAAEVSLIADSSRRQAELRILVKAAGRWNRRLQETRITKRNRRALRGARSPRRSRPYEKAWILIDRPARADDNAEHLYRHIIRNHPEINSWFMIDRNSADWTRLLEDGFRLIPYGEEKAVSAVLSARYIISSHMDDDIYRPSGTEFYGESDAEFVFLQHGITMNDISKWINTKELALVTACSPAELEAFVQDESYYRLNRLQVKLTGFPRHDRLIQLSEYNFARDRTSVLIVPTWRKSLVSQLGRVEGKERRLDILRESDFYQGWFRLLNDERFIAKMKELECRPVFALHDHLAVYRELFAADDLYDIRIFSELSMQEALAGSRLVITDYSSLSVDAAISGATVLYYQFDGQKIYDGEHSFGRSWFNYETDGVGPVCLEVDKVIEEMLILEEREWLASEVYAKRLSSLVPNLDGNASSRVVNELKNILA